MVIMTCAEPRGVGNVVRFSVVQQFVVSERIMRGRRRRKEKTWIKNRKK